MTAARIPRPGPVVPREPLVLTRAQTAFESADNQLKIAARLNEIDDDVVDVRAYSIVLDRIVRRIARKLDVAEDDTPSERERVGSSPAIEHALGELRDEITERLPKPSPMPTLGKRLDDALDRRELDRWRKIKSIVVMVLAGSASVGIWELVKHVMGWKT